MGKQLLFFFFTHVVRVSDSSIWTQLWHVLASGGRLTSSVFRSWALNLFPKQSRSKAGGRATWVLLQPPAFTQGGLHRAEFKWPLSRFLSQLTITVGNYITRMMSADQRTAALGKGRSWQKTSCVHILVGFYVLVYNIGRSITHECVCLHSHVCLDVNSLLFCYFCV